MDVCMYVRIFLVSMSVSRTTVAWLASSWVDGRTYICMYVSSCYVCLSHRCPYECMDGWMDGWMETGWMGVRIYVCMFLVSMSVSRSSPPSLRCFATQGLLPLRWRWDRLLLARVWLCEDLTRRVSGQQLCGWTYVCMYVCV